MLAFCPCIVGFHIENFTKLRWASTLNQKHLFVITSLSTNQFEYGVKFSMEIQIFCKIVEFILTLASISPLFYARGRASFKHGGEVIVWHKCYVSIMLQKVLRSKREKNEKRKKIWWEEKKSKKNRKNKVKKRKREKWEGNKIKVKNIIKMLLDSFCFISSQVPWWQIHTQIFQPCAIR
jgi:hypothetical protein